MIIGLGIDLVEVGRVERMLEQWSSRLLHRLMEADEQEALVFGEARPRALAFSIAAKEAASKAIGTGWSQGVRWRDVVLWTSPEPSIELRGEALLVARRLGSAGRTRVRLRSMDDLVLAEVWLFSR